MRKIFSILPVLAFCLCLLSYSIPSKVLADGAGGCSSGSVVITGIQAGEIHYNNHEFVELYNCSNGPIDLAGYSLSLRAADGAEKAKIPLSGIIVSQSFLWVLHGYYANYLATNQGLQEPYITFSQDTGNFSAIDAGGGYILLSAPNGLQIDQVAYGSVDDLSLLSAPKPPSGQSIKRCISSSGVFSNTHNSSEDFLVTALPALSYLFLPGPPCSGGSDDSPGSDTMGSGNDDNGNQNNNDSSGNNGNNEGSGGMGGGLQNSCKGVIINELLPNPAGSDSGHEFVELHNPSDEAIDLTGCKLQISASSKTYEFSDEQINPGQYKAFYDSETGLTLANSSGGSVYLIDTDNTEISEADYAPNLDDDVSWSLFSGKWQSSFSVTPNSPNKLVTIKPCPAGQIRNTDTNRCINTVSAAAGLDSCPAGKERNPETNRCKNIASFASVLKACSAGQERNPDTGRCRKITSESSLAPCKPGQERNPETHRCRKATVATAGAYINGVKDVLSQTSDVDRTSWYISAGTILGAFLYAFWEWRNEIFQRFGLVKARFGQRL